MSKKPSGFHAARKHPLNLPGRNSFLASAHQVNNLKPKMQRQMRGLENSSLSDSELPLAFIAFAKAKAGGLALKLSDTLRVSIAAMWANWAIRPKFALDIRKSGFLIQEAGIVKSGLGHGGISYGLNSTPGGSLCQV
jgi:hypothetical protein